MTRISGGAAQLEKAAAALREAYAASADGWRDRAREEFAEQHLHALEARLRQAVQASRQLESLLTEAVRTCG
jgi:hypothetical protein